MSCWVVPALAAEIWGIPLPQILDAIRSGQLPTRSAIGLTFVDVAPNSSQIAAHGLAARPRTFTTPAPAGELSDAELSAITGEVADEPPLPIDDAARDEERTSTVDEHEEGRLDWRQSRRDAARRRQPPQRPAA